MKARPLILPILAIATALAGLFIITTVLMGQGNQLGTLCRYLLVAGFVMGWTFPRRTLVFWLIFCGYTDLLKRLMVVFGSVRYSDLYNVLGIPPAMLAGITMAVLLGAMSGTIKTQKMHWRLFGIACVLMLASAVLAAKSSGGSLGAIVPSIVNDGAYAMLIFVVPVLFQGTDDLVRLAKILLWAYLPVAIYGVVQRIVGFQPFEIAYLKTNLSMEIKQLYAHEVRAFSTMNSPTSLSVVSGVLCVFSAILALTPARDERRALQNKIVAALLCLVYVAAVVASTSRSTFLFIAVALGGFFCFRSRFATRILYAGLAAAFFALMFFSEFLLMNLDPIQDAISSVTGETEFVYQLTRVGTFADRLMGFSRLWKNPEAYTAFGYGSSRGHDEYDPLYAHDLLGNMLVVHGVVPLLALVVVGTVILRKLHRLVTDLPDPHHRRLAAGMVALGFSFFAISAVSGNVLGVFPVNVFLWLCLGFFALICQSGQGGEPATGPAPVPAPASASAASPTPGRAVHRFRRSGLRTSTGAM
jgi:hypothetical protein